MNARKVIDFLNIIEQESSIINWKYKDLDFWPLLRLELYAAISIDLMSMTRNNGVIARVKSLAIGNLKYPFKYLADFKKNASFQKKDILFLSDGISFTKVKGKSFEKFIDPLVLEMDKRYLSSVRLDPYHNYHTPRFSSSIFIQPSLDPLIIGEFLSTKEVEGSQENRDILRRVFKENDLEKFYSVIDQTFVKAKLIYRISLFFEKKIKKVNPKIAFIVWYYGVYGMAMILACRRLSIPTVDLQHGVQGSLHAAYGGWQNVPKQGYNLLPDFFWCWSKDETEAINEWSASLPIHKAILGGNMLLEKWNSDDLPFVMDLENIFNQLNLTGFKILVTLSPGISGPAVLDNLFKVIAQTQKEYSWMIRIHPNMLMEIDKVVSDLRSYGIYKYEMDEVSKLPLYTVLKNTDLHITHSSSTVLEACSFGIPNIIVNEYGRELYEKQISDNLAVVKILVEEISEEIAATVHKENKIKVDNVSFSESAINQLLASSNK